MMLVTNRFGLRSQPKWAKNDLSAHWRLEVELKRAFKLVKKHVPYGLPEHYLSLDWDEAAFDAMSRRARVHYFLDYAMRLQRAYHLLMETLQPYSHLEVTRSMDDSGYRLVFLFEDQEYRCNYLNDHICCLVWVVGKINMHLSTRIKKP